MTHLLLKSMEMVLMNKENNNFIISQLIVLLLSILLLNYGGWTLSFINIICLHIKIEKNKFEKISKSLFIINIIVFIISFSYLIYNYNK